MSAESIYINYISTMEKADHLDDLAQRLYAASRTVEEEASACAYGTWEGSCRDAYLEKNRRESDKMRAHAKKLERCADILRFSARQYYNSELFAQSLFGG